MVLVALLVYSWIESTGGSVSAGGESGFFGKKGLIRNLVLPESVPPQANQSSGPAFQAAGNDFAIALLSIAFGIVRLAGHASR